MWRPTLFNAHDPEHQAAALRAFLSLDRAVRGTQSIEQANPGSVEAAQSIACWALLHGFARLAIDGMFGSEPGSAERATEGLLPAVLGHLDLLG